MASARRLRCIQHALAPSSQVIGTLTPDDISYPFPASATPSCLPHITLLDPNDPCTCEHLYFLLQKFVLGQDVFPNTQPGPYAEARAHVLRVRAYFSLPPIGCGVDGKTACVAVRAVKMGRIFIIEAIEKAERGTMPVLNNLLENREINLEDGTHTLHHRHTLIPPADAVDARFTPAHPSFRVIAIGALVPPCTGYPLDPPFRSCFQMRFLDPISTLLAYPDSPRVLPEVSAALWTILRDLTELVTASSRRTVSMPPAAPTSPLLQRKSSSKEDSDVTTDSPSGSRQTLVDADSVPPARQGFGAEQAQAADAEDDGDASHTFRDHHVTTHDTDHERRGRASLDGGYGYSYDSESLAESAADESEHEHSSLIRRRASDETDDGFVDHRRNNK
ncbi:hypothetical protein BJV78DRAFT_1281368 [Lactifluus subvellereus]|nr:hypothetical protein BJV78DRAFT_1281368 [Lactifluus subvellereus]